jgi:GNAT superfamily N-acetyltransferase
MKTLDIKYLADCPETVYILAGWFYDEWGGNNPALSPRILEEALKERLNKDKLPLCLVGLYDNRPVATASLRIREMETHPQYPDWLGSVYVIPEVRGRGFGRMIVRAAVNEARRLGLESLYLYTRNKEQFYAKSGWKVHEHVEYRKRSAIIMKLML